MKTSSLLPDINSTAAKLSESFAVQSLLTQVSAISKKYEEVAKVTGENFNIFKILKIARKETVVHTPIIAELLNPNGSHGQYDKFLRLFVSHLEQIKVPVCVNSWEGVKVLSEKRIGSGQVDILVKFKDFNLVIENKIDAYDGNHQLINYFNDFVQGGRGKLIYLNLFGTEPSDISLHRDGNKINVNEDFFILSYRKDILEWLELCREKSVSYPLLRETLTQYINLLKGLTDQTINNAMGKEIVNLILSSPEFIGAAITIGEEWEKAKELIVQNLFSKLKSFAEQKGINVSFKGNEIYFSKSEWKALICYSFSKDREDIQIGLASLEPGHAWIDNEYIEEWNDTPWEEVLDKAPTLLEKYLIDKIQGSKEKGTL